MAKMICSNCALFGKDNCHNKEDRGDATACSYFIDKESFSVSRVNHPSYYQLPGGVEAITIARHLNFNLGNVVKYVVRAGRKSESGMTDKAKALEDLHKALFYLKDEIERVNKMD